MIVRSNPEGVHSPSPIYSHLAVVPAGCDLLVLAGQIGMDQDRRLATGVAAQLAIALDNVATILVSEGLDFDALIKMNLWIVGETPIDAIREAFKGRLREPPPMTVAFVSGLARPDILVEVEAWAARMSAPVTRP